jgi:hypothetical protein
MKIAQKYSVGLLFVAFFGPSAIQADAPAVDTYGVVFHLFNPVPQRGAQKRLNHQLVEKALAAGGDFNQAFMALVRPFLLSEAKAAFEAVATEQGKNINSQACAELLLQEKLEKPYFEKHGKNIYSENPLDLPEHVFTYFVNPYLHSVLRMQELPEMTRDLLSFGVAVIGYLELIRVGINYAQTGINYAQTGVNVVTDICDKFGVPKP